MRRKTAKAVESERVRESKTGSEGAGERAREHERERERETADAQELVLKVRDVAEVREHASEDGLVVVRRLGRLRRGPR